MEVKKGWAAVPWISYSDTPLEIEIFNLNKSPESLSLHVGWCLLDRSDVELLLVFSDISKVLHASWDIVEDSLESMQKDHGSIFENDHQ